MRTHRKIGNTLFISEYSKYGRKLNAQVVETTTPTNK